MHVPECVVICRNVSCKDPKHKIEIDSYVTNILSNISESGHETIPMKEPKPMKNKNSKSLAGWKDLWNHFKEMPNFGIQSGYQLESQ